MRSNSSRTILLTAAVVVVLAACSTAEDAGGAATTAPAETPQVTAAPATDAADSPSPSTMATATAPPTTTATPTPTATLPTPAAAASPTSAAAADPEAPEGSGTSAPTEVTIAAADQELCSLVVEFQNLTENAPTDPEGAQATFEQGLDLLDQMVAAATDERRGPVSGVRDYFAAFDDAAAAVGYDETLLNGDIIEELQATYTDDVAGFDGIVNDCGL